MRKPVYSLLVLFVSLLMLTSCGTTGSDNSLMALLGLGGGSSEPGTFSKHVFGTGIGASSTNILFNSTASEGRFMILSLASEIKGAGFINSISFKFTGSHVDEATCSAVTIKMGHTSVNNLSTTYLDNVETTGGGRGKFETVFTGSVTIPVGSSGTYFSIPLDTSFHYNGVDNLVIEVVRTAAATGDVEIAAPPHTSGNYHMVYGTGAGSSADTVADLATSQFPYLRLDFVGGDDAIVNSGSSNLVPFYSGTNKRIQLLYTKDRINGSGSITGVGFVLGAMSGGMESTVTVRLGHTTLNELVDISWDANFDSGNPVTVANAAVFKVPNGAPAGSTIWLPLSRYFNYNGTDNLVVDVNVITLSGSINLEMNSSGTLTRLAGTADAPVSSVDNAQYSIKLRFKGGTADVMTSTGAGGGFPFYTDDNMGQYLYLSPELGTGGIVKGLAFRLLQDSKSALYNSFTVVMSNTTSSTLGTTFSANMTDPTTVYSGTFSVPGGLKAGDWMEIPLSEPFTYDISKNLVVQMSALAGGQQNPIRFTSDAARFPNRHAWANTTATDTGVVIDQLADIRLTFK